MIRIFLSLSLFCLLGYLSKVHERLLTNRLCFQSVWPLMPGFITQYVQCPLSGFSPETRVHRPSSFPSIKEIFCAFFSFWDLCTSSGHFLTQGFIKEGSLPTAQLVFTNLQHSPPRQKWAFSASYRLRFPFVLRIPWILGHVKLVRY